MENRIRAARKAVGMTQHHLAEKMGVGTPQVSRWEAGKVELSFSRMVAIAKAIGVPTSTAFPLSGYDHGPSSMMEPNAHPVRMEGASAERMREDLPVYGTALGAAREVDGIAIEQTTLNTGEVMHYAKRPTILNGNAAAYGLYVAGSSMDPRYRDGEMLLADPKGRIRGGEDVIVYLRPKNAVEDDGLTARAVLVKTLIRRTSTYIELEQFSPAKIFRIDMDEVVRVDRVIPWQELLG